MRSVVFSFFISIIPTLIPVVGVKRLHLDPAHLGYLFTSMAIGSVVGAVFITSWARARFSPNKLTICANLLLVSVGFLMALVDHPHVFMLVAALGGAGWTLTASELWIAGQRAMPEWARGRMNATIIMASQAATALGGLVWGAAAEEVGVVATFLALGFFAVLAMLFVHVIWKELSIDFATDLDFEPAQFAILLLQRGPRQAYQGESKRALRLDGICRGPRPTRSIYWPDARSPPHLPEERRTPVAFVRRRHPTGQVHHGSGLVLGERIFAAA